LTRQEIDGEFGRYQLALVEGQLAEVKTEIENLQRSHPEIQAFATEQIREELLAIESDTYAEFIRAGQLKDELAPLLQTVLPEDAPT
jgi:CPA1 family monovalent cation:H+ antiporter